jgi:hypothetical protein
MILRGIYDAMLQALYIMNDINLRVDRATLYLEFYWVEKMESIRMYDENSTYLAGRLSNSPMRPDAEADIVKRYRAVGQKFKTVKGKLRRHWYAGDLRDLAKDVHLESEYEILQKHLSAVVHASSFALQEIPQYSGYMLLAFAWQLSFRVLSQYSCYVGIELSEIQRELIRISTHNAFDNPRDLSAIKK